MNFESFNFHPSIITGVRALGCSVPTPMQLQAIAHILQGHDVIGIEKTGTGKTAVFALPVLESLRQDPCGRVRALILSPTREMAEQTSEVINTLAVRTGLQSVAVFGGVGAEQQNRELRRGADIIVACPGRLIEHLWKGTISLSELEILVIDEADQLLDMGFLPDIYNVLACIVNRRQTLLFSATIPAGILRLTHEIMHNPVTIRTDKHLSSATISQAQHPVEPPLKTALLKEILGKTKKESVFVFTRTGQCAERVARQLKEAGYQVSCFQGNLPQNRRQAALKGLLAGSFQILVVTDIAALGIDISSISHVVHHKMPESTDNYVHRIGRPVRVSNDGDALTFVTGADADKISALEQLLEAPLKCLTIEGF